MAADGTTDPMLSSTQVQPMPVMPQPTNPTPVPVDANKAPKQTSSMPVMPQPETGPGYNSVPVMPEPEKPPPVSNPTPKVRPGTPDGGIYNAGGPYETGYRDPNSRNWSEQPVQTDGGATTGGRAPGLYTAGGAPQVTVDKVNTSAFMNPFVKDAVEPAMRDIEKRFAGQRNQIGGTAASSGAFGDDRHRMLDQAAYKDERSALSDTYMQAMKSGYDTSLAAAERDSDRLLGASQFNAGLQNNSIDRQVGVQENAANRSLTWDQFLNGLDQQEQDRSLRAAELGNALDMSQNAQLMQYGQQALSADNYARGWNQQQAQADYEDYMQKVMWPATQLAASKGLSSPQGQQGSNDLASILGSFMSFFG